MLGTVALRASDGRAEMGGTRGVKARGRKGGALGFRSEPRGELFVLLAGGARTAPVVNAAVTARVACEEQAEHTLWEEWRAARRGGGG